MILDLVHPSDASRIDPEAWNRLAEISASPNPFYERWMLLPALKNLDADCDIYVVTVVHDEKLVCLFPICIDTSILNIRFIEVWRYRDCFLTDVLWDKDGVSLDVLFDELMKAVNAKFVISTFHTRTGFYDGSSKRICRTSRLRAGITNGICWDDHLSALPSKQRSEHKRIVKRLLGQDDVRYVVSTKDLATVWLPMFMEMERRGWKGAEGNALANDEQIDGFYREVFAMGELEQKIQVHAILNADGPLAISFSYITRRISYEIKTTFNEQYKTLYPGVVLELLKIRHVLDGSYERADSCAVPRNSLMNKLWPDRVEISRSMYFSKTPLGKVGILTCDTRLALRKLTRSPMNYGPWGPVR